MQQTKVSDMKNKATKRGIGDLLAKVMRSAIDVGLIELGIANNRNRR